MLHGFNIDSLTVGRTENAGVSRMTIVVEGDKAVLEQVRKQLGKVIDVLKVSDYSGRDIVQRDLALVKLNAPPAEAPEIVSLIEIFHGNVVDISSTDMVVELSGPEAKVDAFVEVVRPYGIRETGPDRTRRPGARGAEVSGRYDVPYLGDERPGRRLFVVGG